jgi:hypothetical protein
VTAHLEDILREFGAVRALPRMRKHALWYARRFVGVEELRLRIFAEDHPLFVLDSVRRFFEADPKAFDPSHPERREIERRFRQRVLFWTTSVPLPEG